MKYEAEDYQCLSPYDCHTKGYGNIVTGVDRDRLERKRERNRVAANKCR